MVKVNRTQGLVLGFFLVVWVSLLAILMAAPEVYDQALSLPGDGGAAESRSWPGCCACRWPSCS
jgi:hypothetical protein